MAFVRSLILSFSLSLAVCRFFPGYLDLDFLVLDFLVEDLEQGRDCDSAAAGLLKTKQSKEFCSFPAALNEVGEKLKESTVELGDRLLPALK